jgi:hypothetical protein
MMMKIVPVLFAGFLVFSGCEQPAGVLRAPVAEETPGETPGGTPGETPGETPAETAGTLAYAVALPAGIALNGEASFIRIGRDGAALGSLNTGGFADGKRPVTESVQGEIRLDSGVYEVDIALCRSGDGYLVSLREEIELAAGERREISFSPDFSPDSPDTPVTAAGSFKLTAGNTSKTKLEASGGGVLQRTQSMSAPHDTAAVYFYYEMEKTSYPYQTLAVEGADGAKVTMTDSGSLDGTTARNGRVIFRVDMADIAEFGGDRVFNLLLGEAGKQGIRYTVTVSLPLYERLRIDAYPVKRNYAAGGSFDAEGLAMTEFWSDGASAPVTGGWDVAGFDSSTVGEQQVSIVKRGVTAREYDDKGNAKAGTETFPVTIRAAQLYFDGSGYTPGFDLRPAVYTLATGRTLVLAPVKWYVPDSAAYRWTVDGASQSSVTEYLSYTASAASGDHTVRVEALNGSAVLASAEATVQCVSGAVKRDAGPSSAAKAAKLTAWTVVAPGQFGSTSSRLGDLHGAGGFGGYSVFMFDHSVEKRGTGGEEIHIGGNAFPGWEEAGVIWVSQDENGNGEPDDTWYELKGSHTFDASAVRRYALMFRNNYTWEDNQGIVGTYPSLQRYSGGNRESLTLTGTLLPLAAHMWGYADVYDNGRLSLSNAIQADGSAADVPFIDFLKIVTGQNKADGSVGEHSTEAGTPTDRSIVDPDKVLEGTKQGSQYKYEFTNSSDYDLTITFCGKDFSLAKGAKVVRMEDAASAQVDFSGGNAVMKRSAGGYATFVSG